MAEVRGSDFQIYNTMTKQKEKFVPLVPGKVAMYVCGVTSYDFSHIGHARAYVAFDVLFRYIFSRFLNFSISQGPVGAIRRCFTYSINSLLFWD